MSRIRKQEDPPGPDLMYRDSVPADVFTATQLICFSVTQIPRLLFRIDMPDHIVRQSNNLISSPLCHLGESLRLRLVFERVAREIDT
jgi:hypothetical protein